MIQIANWARGMRVITARKLLARIDGLVIETHGDGQPRVNVTYHDPAEGCGVVLVRLLTGYTGPPVVFADELDLIHNKYEPGAPA